MRRLPRSDMEGQGDNWYIPDEDAEFYASVLVASGSDADPDGSIPSGGDFQVFVAISLGIIAGVMLVGSRRF